MELTNEAKNAILNIFANAAWSVPNGQQYYDALADAFFGVASISAVYTQSGDVYDTDTLDDLKADLVVTATLKDSTTETVPDTDYTLSGTLAVGTSTITVSYGGKTTTFNVTVTEAPLWTFTNGYSLGKGSNSSASSYRKVWRQTTEARACGSAPIENKGYVFTVTDSSKYNLCAYDVTDNTPITNTHDASVDKIWYQGGAKTIAWAASDSVTSAYVWLCLKKMDGTAFTTEELANGAEAVFTFTKGS